MNLRAINSVWWPGITRDIESLRLQCGDCDVNAPSLPAAPPTQLDHPTYPFEHVCADYFFYLGHMYLVLVDRYSNWPSVFFPKNGNSIVLVEILREYFATFGCPKVISTDQGSSFMSFEVEEFLQRWEVHHRVSSAYYPHSNLRAETAVKTVKRIIMGNVSADGSLDNDDFVAALLQYRNTPDRDLKLSPAQILFARELRDAVPVHGSRLKLCKEWILTAEAREVALARRHQLREEALSEHTRKLPILDVGDVVQVQNQRGPKANKWSLSGVIVESLGNNQYRVKMDGSGRVSLRNGQFLKRIHPVSSRLSPRGASSSANSGGQTPTCELEMDGAEVPQLRRSQRLRNQGEN